MLQVISFLVAIPVLLLLLLIQLIAFISSTLVDAILFVVFSLTKIVLLTTRWIDNKTPLYFYIKSIDIIIKWRRLINFKFDAIFNDWVDIDSVKDILHDFWRNIDYCNVRYNRLNHSIIAEFVFKDIIDAQEFHFKIQDMENEFIMSELQGNRVIVEIELDSD